VGGNCFRYGGNDFQFHSILFLYFLLYPSIFLDFASKRMHSGYSATKIKTRQKVICAQALKFRITFHKP